MAIEVGCFSATKLTNGTINCSRCVPLSEVATTPRTELDFHSTIGVIQRLLVGKPELQIAGKGGLLVPVALILRWKLLGSTFGQIELILWPSSILLMGLEGQRSAFIITLSYAMVIVANIVFYC